MTGTGPDLTAAACWDQAVRRHGPRRFLRAPGHDLSYAEFDRWACAVAARLAGLGVRAGHPPERTVAGAVDATTLAAPPGAEDGPVPELAVVDTADPWAILYTSGSTSRPRGVVIPQRAFGVTGQALADAHGYGPGDTVLSVQPLHHASATLMSWAPAAAAGASLALVERFSVSGFWALVRQAGATVAIVVPTVAELLLTAPPAPGDRDHPLRLLVTHYDVPAFAARFGTEVGMLWGMTETSGLGLTTRAGEPTADGVVSRP